VKTTERLRIALIAHDAKKGELADWAHDRRQQLADCALMATGNTGLQVLGRCPELSVERLLSGPLGGDQQIGARIAEGSVDALVSFIDPLPAMPHDVDVKALIRIALLKNIQFALNRAMADCIVLGSQLIAEAKP
jgi:methylglyoxal synthase